jgi:hypothetical protein
MNDTKSPWQTPSVEQLDVSGTLGGGLVNSDNGTMDNNAFPNPS